MFTVKENRKSHLQLSNLVLPFWHCYFESSKCPPSASTQADRRHLHSSWFTTDWSSSHQTVWCAYKSGDVVNFIIVARRISSRLKQYKNYRNRLRLAKVIVKNKMSRFLWFTVYVRK